MVKFISMPHDTLKDVLLFDPKRFTDFLWQNLSNEFAGLIDWSVPPEFVDRGLVNEMLGRSQTDLLVKMRLLSGEDMFAYVLGEHKSSPDVGLPLQLAKYMVQIWEGYAGQSWKKLRALPPILPIVIYSGKKKWNVPSCLRDMIAADDPALRILPGESYILRNLSKMKLEEMAQDSGLRAGFSALRGDRIEQIVELLAEVDEDLRIRILEYVSRVFEVDFDGLRAIIREAGHSGMEANVATIAETMHKKGKAEGVVIGKAEGVVIGEVKTLLRLLERRFGPLSPDLRERVNNAKQSEIATWFDIAIDAPDLETVFGGGRIH